MLSSLTLIPPELDSIPRGPDGPVFSAPWEARAFAIALALHEQGVFSWSEWAAALADEIKRAQRPGNPGKSGSACYQHWLAALETLLSAKGIAGEGLLGIVRNCWDEAARKTPHGTAVELKMEPRAIMAERAR